ncbi:MAG: hypothetical protein RMK45_05385 [Armatimonadota bacterium]|nr:hypothetical protein [Armatimonadota bacterium]
MASVFALQAIGVLAAMPLLRLARLESAILPTGTLYAGMAHLRGSHLMYGAILETLRFVGQNVVKYGMPIFLLLGLYATASIGHSVWFALLASLYTLALSSLLVWTNLRSYLHRALGRTVSLAGCLFVVVFNLAVAIGIAFVSVMVSPQGTIPLPSNPLAWLSTLVWWLSLIPPLLAIYTLFVEFHPLWGVPQIALMAWVSYLCVRGGASELEQFRRLCEQPASQTRTKEKVGEWG